MKLQPSYLCAAAILAALWFQNNAFAESASAGASAPTRAAFSKAETLEAYKKEIAHLVYKASARQIFLEPAKPLLKSVIVMNVVIGPDGHARATVMRGNGFPELEQAAMESLRRAGPFPTFKGATGEIAYMETFLFRHDDRFQMRSIAPVQLTQ